MGYDVSGRRAPLVEPDRASAREDVETTGAGRYVGIDLAWGPRARSGLAVTDESGALVSSASVRTDEEIDAWLVEHAPTPSAIGIDAPLVVRNPPKTMREAEKQISRTWGRYGASAYPSHTGNPIFVPPRGGVLAERHGWSLDPRVAPTPSTPVALEVYPHPATVAFFGLARTLPYKAKRGRSPESRRTAFAVLCGHLERVAVLGLSRHPRWRELRHTVLTATRHVELERVEDEIDAVLCAYLAWCWVHRPGSLVLYGDPAADLDGPDGGVIVAPPPLDRTVSGDP